MHDLVIFDCDGVLVDSELIFWRILGECLIAIDFPTTIDEAVALGLGKNRVTLSAAVETRFGRKLPDAFFELFAARSTDAFERELRPMPGVEELLAALPTPRCVASNGHLDRVRQRLSLTRLLSFFDPHVFSASQIERGKPAPDPFCSRPGSSALSPAVASWWRTVSLGSRQRSLLKCQLSAFAAEATAPAITLTG